MKKMLSMALGFVLAMVMAIPMMANPASGNANQNSFLGHTHNFHTALDVRIGGNGNSARLVIVRTDEGAVAEIAASDRPVNDKINTVAGFGYEIDVFVRGNKIDKIIGWYDLNCYHACPECADKCDPTRETPCDGICDCIDDCGNGCYKKWLKANVCPPCSSGVGQNHTNCHTGHKNHFEKWANCQCCGMKYNENWVENEFVPNECCPE